MSECGSPMMRDLLPEYLHRRLDVAGHASVEAHIAECDECRLELAMLSSVRQAMRQRVPAIDTAAIVRALPRPPRRRLVRPTMMQLAATLSFLSLGGASLVVARSFYDRGADVVAEDSARTVLGADSGAGGRLLAIADPGLTVGGGVADLGADQIELLLGELESLEAIPSAEPDEFPTQDTTRASGAR